MIVNYGNQPRMKKNEWQSDSASDQRCSIQRRSDAVRARSDDSSPVDYDPQAHIQMYNLTANRSSIIPVEVKPK